MRQPLGGPLDLSLLYQSGRRPGVDGVWAAAELEALAG